MHLQNSNQRLLRGLALLLLLLLVQLPVSSSLRANRRQLPNGCPLPLLPSVANCQDLAGRVYLDAEPPSPISSNSSNSSIISPIHSVAGCRRVPVRQFAGRRCRDSAACFVKEECADRRLCREVPEPRRPLADVFLGPCLGQFAYQLVPAASSRCLPVGKV